MAYYHDELNYIIFDQNEQQQATNQTEYEGKMIHCITIIIIIRNFPYSHIELIVMFFSDEIQIIIAFF